MAGKSGRRRPSAKFTDLVDRAANAAAHLGDRAAQTVLTTIEVAAGSLVAGSSVPDESQPMRRRSSATGGATQSVMKAAAKTNRKLAKMENKVAEKPDPSSPKTKNPTLVPSLKSSRSRKR